MLSRCSPCEPVNCLKRVKWRHEDGTSCIDRYFLVRSHWPVYVVLGLLVGLGGLRGGCRSGARTRREVPAAQTGAGPAEHRHTSSTLKALSLTANNSSHATMWDLDQAAIWDCCIGSCMMLGMATGERTAVTRAIPDDSVVGTEQKTARPVANASFSKGICSMANPRSGVRPRMDTSPYIRPAGALSASMASCVFSVSPEIRKIVQR